jgi:hypothetical protein
MAVLINASILIESERGRLRLDQHLAQQQQEEFFLSFARVPGLAVEDWGGPR